MKLLLTASIVALATSAEGASLGLVASDPAPGVASTLTLSVDIDADQVSCFSFSVEYDPALLQYLGASEGLLFDNSPEMTFFSDDLDGMGRPQPNDCLLGFQTTVTGPGTIAQLDFLVLDDSATTVTLRDPLLRDIDRLPIAGVEEVTVSINAVPTAAPFSFGPGQLSAHPNPSSSQVELVLSDGAPASSGRLRIFDISGRLVRELNWPAGAQRVGWDGRDHTGRPVANGVYHMRFESASRRVHTRIVRVR